MRRGCFILKIGSDIKKLYLLEVNRSVRLSIGRSVGLSVMNSLKDESIPINNTIPHYPSK